MDVEFKNVLTESNKLVLYYLGGGVPWLDDVQSNYQTDVRDCIRYYIAFVSDAGSYKRCQKNHRHPQVKVAVVGRHIDSICSMQVDTHHK